MTSEWLPQIPLLLHAKTKLFITHGGLKSIMEGICAKLPLLVFPMFSEQFRQSVLVRQHGIGNAIDRFNMTSPQYMQSLVNDILIENHEKYMRNALRLGESLQDQLISPLEVGAFYSEFAIRHVDKLGMVTKLCHVRGLEMSNFIYFNFDLIVFVIFLLIFVITMIVG